MAEWRETRNGEASEGGVLVRHEEYWQDGSGAGITLERECRRVPAAITCGLYGFMVHTRFFLSLAEAELALAEMKAGLEELVHASVREDFALRQHALFQAFVNRFP